MLSEHVSHRFSSFKDAAVGRQSKEARGGGGIPHLQCGLATVPADHGGDSDLPNRAASGRTAATPLAPRPSNEQPWGCDKSRGYFTREVAPWVTEPKDL